MPEREALVVDLQEVAQTILPTEAVPGWRMNLTSSIEIAARILRERRCTVGIAIFDPGRPQRRAEIEPLLQRAGIEWIALLSAADTQDPEVRALVADAFYDYHTLPIDASRLTVIMGHAHGKALLTGEPGHSRGDSHRYGMDGASEPMRALFRQLEKVFAVDAAVLIGGESGTGKELVARAIHQHCRRRGGSFIAVNCAAIPTTLIQSELFGYEKGAFTGAQQRKMGKIEAADGGVLFLDEIGDLSLELQANLLRFLEERRIVRVGSSQAVPVDVRIVAATHVDLERAVAEGRFRQDLYYRLNVLTLQVPPLRDRGSDLHLLARRILQRYSAEERCRSKGFSSGALRAMSAHSWPGNVRELVNRVRRAAIMSDSRLISAADLGLESHVSARDAITLEGARACAERDVIEACLRAHDHNVSRAALQLGVSRVTLYRMISRHNINRQRTLGWVANVGEETHVGRPPLPPPQDAAKPAVNGR